MIYARLSTLLKDAGLYKAFTSILNETEDDIRAFAALYWLCSDHHQGQHCPLYAILSQCGYTPGWSERTVPDDSLEYYDRLVAARMKYFDRIQRNQNPIC